MKYKIKIQEGYYTDVFELTTDVEPETINAIINNIYTELKIETERQAEPKITVNGREL